MSEFKICRICLEMNVRMHLISGSDIQDVYEKLTNKKVEEVEMPYFACYICYCHLRTCQQLVIKSQKSEELLQQILSINYELDGKSIAFLDRVSFGLASSLVVSNAEYYQLRENGLVKTDNREETCINEGIIKQEPDDNSMPPNKKCKLDENRTFKQDKDSCLENEKKNTTGIKINTVTIGSISLPIVCDIGRKQEPVDNDENTFICNDCGKTCETKALLIKHETTHRLVVTTSNNSEEKLTENDNMHLKNNPCQKPFKCRYCTYTAKKKDHLKIHIRIHTGEKPYKCQYCNYSSAHNSTLTRHIRTHTGEKPLKCSYCNYTCLDNTYLKKHIQHHIWGESTLKIHMRAHTGEKPYKCEHCKYSSAHNSTLTRHIRIHTGEKRSKCSYSVAVLP